ncbi:unnamed protein product [Rotaria magnacalcarata]|uniref:Uncharacterized protein n=2 Tax=Rotaria magnacalcarata TaxID=392030 RepID=A0A818Z2J9_9BILA|nr:unnamed protein product [Rotaria magnacalcarata]CAF3758142.1 unnamed protein product [Rotaria magnacalcarata]
MNSTSDSIKNLPLTDPIITSKNNHIKRSQTLLNKLLHTESNEEYVNKVNSNSQLNNIVSKTQIDITPETVNHLNRHQSTALRRSRVKWVARHASILSTGSFQTNSLNEFQINSMADANSNQDIPLNPTISIPDMTAEEVDVEYQNFIEKIYEDEIDEALQCANSSALSSDDEEEDDGNTNNHNNIREDNGHEQLETTKVFIDQGSQIILVAAKSKRKIKSPQRKRSKASPRRVKHASAMPSQASMSLSSPTNQSTHNGDTTTATTNSMRASASVAKTEENNAAKRLITVDTSKARSNLQVVRLCLRELGWKECVHGSTVDSDIYWHSASFHEGNTTFPFTSGRVNKFPCMSDLLRKVHLTRSLNNMRLLFPNEYDFYPKTWFLPEQSQQFKDDVRYLHQLDKKHNRSPTTFIVKPSDGSQGEGIYLLRDPSHIINTNRPHVIQEYIDQPLLMNGLKFDLRIYVLILNLYPLEVYLYDEGLARFATVDYKAPSTENLHETYMHLTNYSLNKRSAGYKHPVDDKQTDGSKRKLSIVWKQLSEMFSNEKVERTKNLIVEMINKTIFSILPELRVAYEYELPLPKRQNLSCFQIIGFDIILNHHLKPILLEVNSNPSLRIDFDKNEAGKIIYQPSPIDEEIKRPLVFETLKLALPKKKLDTITRHAKIQANEEIMAQRVEKVAQRRLEERSEKLKSARKTRFDMKLNPFFSRPLESIAKEFVRQQQEQQQHEQKRFNHPYPTHPIIASQVHEDFTPYTFSNNNNNHSQPIGSPRKIIRRTKKLNYPIDDDDENGLPVATTVGETVVLANIKQSSTRSASHRPGTTDAAMLKSINTLKLIFPAEHSTKYRHLLLVDNIAYIYIQLVVTLGFKTMTGGQFRHFANICGIMNESITAPTIDILYYQILKKWQQFVLRTTLTGLPFAAFIEAFFLLSQRKYPNAQNFTDGVNHLVNTSIRHLHLALPRPTSPIIYQQNQYLLLRSARNNNNINSSALNIRSHVGVSRTPSTMSVHRSTNAPASAPAPRNQSQQNNPSTKSGDNKTKQNTTKQSTKSVFPLFFDVL